MTSGRVFAIAAWVASLAVLGFGIDLALDGDLRGAAVSAGFIGITWALLALRD